MSESPPPNSWQRFWNHITHHLIWSTVIAGLIVAGIIGIYHSLTASSGAVKGSAVNASSSTPVSNTPSLVPSTTAAVRWQGVIAINGSGVELDALPPTTGGNIYTLYEDAGGNLNSYQGSFAEWTGSSTPNYPECHNLVLTQGSTNPLQLTSGLEVCVLTGSRRTAYIQVTSQSANGWQAQAIVWNR